MHIPQMIDIFAGRIFENQPSEAAVAFRKLLKFEHSLFLNKKEILHEN